MATLLDFALIQQFELLFPFLFTLTLAWAIMSNWVPVFKGNQTLAGLAAFTLAVMAMFSPIVVKALTLAAPWFLLFIMFLSLVLVGLYTLGVQEQTVVGVITNERWGFIGILVIIVMLVIAVGSLTKAVADEGGFGPGVQSGQEAEFYNTLFNPSVLGVIFLFVVAFFTIMVLGKK